MTASAPPPAATPAVPPATSMTHQHLLAVLSTRVASLKREHRSLRVCDMGCGDGHLLGYLARALPLLHPEVAFDFAGVDVSDSGVQATGFFQRTVAHLSGAAPGTDWAERLHLIRSTDPWPFEDGALHLVVSNQVLEHVGDHRHFFTELFRTGANGAFSTHLFPIAHNWWEGHLHMPFAHWFGQHEQRRRYIAWMSRVGIGGFRAHRDAMGMTLPTYAEEHADYIQFMTNYRTWDELLALAKGAGLRADFQWTERYYLEKLRQRLGRAPQTAYAPASALGSLASWLIFKRLASVTLNTEKRQSYAR